MDERMVDGAKATASRGSRRRLVKGMTGSVLAAMAAFVLATGSVGAAAPTVATATVKVDGKNVEVRALAKVNASDVKKVVFQVYVPDEATQGCEVVATSANATASCFVQESLDRHEARFRGMIDTKSNRERSAWLAVQPLEGGPNQERMVGRGVVDQWLRVSYQDKNG